MSNVDQKPLGRRHSRWRRLEVVTAIVLVGTVIQYGIFVLRITTFSGRLTGDGWVIALPFIGTLLGLILWRDHRTDPFIAFVFGLAGTLLLSVVNSRLRPTCVSHPIPTSFPYLDYYPGPDWILGRRIAFYPSLQVVQPDGYCYLSVELAVLGAAGILLTAWLWLGEIPEEVLDRLGPTSEGSWFE